MNLFPFIFFFLFLNIFYTNVCFCDIIPYEVMLTYSCGWGRKGTETSV